MAGNNASATDRHDRLLSLLSVHVRSFAIWAVAPDTGLRLPPTDDIKVLFVLQGQGVLSDEDGKGGSIGAVTTLFLPPGRSFNVLSSAEVAEPVPWEDVAVKGGEVVMASTDTRGAPAVHGVCVMLSAKSLSIRLFHNLREALREDMSDDPGACAAFQSMLAELQNPRFGTRTFIEAIMMQCYILALRRQIERGESDTRPMNGSRDPTLGDALLRMYDDPKRDHSVESLARDCGMSRSAFANRFARAFGQSPINMLKEIRMSRAAALLKSTDMPIDTVAASVGYSSRSQFSRSFRMSFDMDPTTFRERSRAQFRDFSPEEHEASPTRSAQQS